MYRYSVAISPPDAVIEQVRLLKQKLRSAIGWYGSANAQAHITFNVFHAEADALGSWEIYTVRFAALQAAVSLRFNHTGSFPNGAFFLAPDEISEFLLIRMMKAFHQQAPLAADKSVTPHMSLGRRLTAGQLSTASVLIQETDIRFVCNDIVLRRFNESRKQYDIYRHFDFGGAEQIKK